MKLRKLQQARCMVGALAVPSFFAATLAGCGGGHEPSLAPPRGALAPSPVVAPPPPPTADLQVVVTDVAQKPLEGINVIVNGCFNGRTGKTAADGTVVFPAVPTCAFGSNPGQVSVNTYHADYFYVSRRVEMKAETTHEERFALEHGSAMAVGVLGTRVLSRLDEGRKLLIEAKLAIVGPDVQLRAGLSESDFSLPSLDCSWGHCGTWLPDGRHSDDVGQAQVEPGSLTRIAGAATRSTYAAGLLLDESKSMTGFDPSAFHRLGSKRFLVAAAAPNSVALAVSRGTLEPTLTVLGSYTQDGASHLVAIDQLTTCDGTSHVLPSLSDFLDYAAVFAPTASSVARRSIVALDRGFWNVGCTTPRTPTCATVRDTAARANAHGIDIVTVGEWHHMAEMAGRTRGAFFWVDRPTQFETTFKAIDAALAGTLDHYTMRFVLAFDGVAPAAGAVLQHYIRVRASTAATFLVPVVVLVD